MARRFGTLGVPLAGASIDLITDLLEKFASITGGGGLAAQWSNRHPQDFQHFSSGGIARNSAVLRIPFDLASMFRDRNTRLLR
jgi:hypothetical protein